jgi:hypothetical protein
MGRPDFGELVTALKTGAAKGERFQPAKPRNFDGARDRKVAFHVSLLKSVSRDASRPNRKNNSRPPPDLVHNEPEFEVEAVLKSRQLRGREREYLVKWKGYHPIEASWVNESDMEHAQEAIEEFHARPAKKKRRT